MAEKWESSNQRAMDTQEIEIRGSLGVYKHGKLEL